MANTTENDVQRARKDALKNHPGNNPQQILFWFSALFVGAILG